MFESQNEKTELHAVFRDPFRAASEPLGWFVLFICAAGRQKLPCVVSGEFNNKNTRSAMSTYMVLLGDLNLDSPTLAVDEVVRLCDCQLDWRSDRTARLPSEGPR
jgi:hypothetical protein